MRVSEFRYAVLHEFGHEYGRVLVKDLLLTRLGSRTAEQAIAQGCQPKDVWLALCEETDVPSERRHGVGLPLRQK